MLELGPVKRSQISPTDIGLMVLLGLSRRVSMVALRNFDVLAGIWLAAILFNTVNIFNFMSWPHKKICFIRVALHPVIPQALIFNCLMPLAISL